MHCDIDAPAIWARRLVEESKYDEDGFGYYIEVHILAGIGNKPSGGGDISIEEIWFRIDSIDDPEENAIPMLVP
jgi:hypothetical protein